MAPKKTKTAAVKKIATTPTPTATSTRPTRKTQQAPPATAVSPPAAAPPKPKLTIKGPKPSTPAGGRLRPLFSNPVLEDHIRTRILDLQYILASIQNFPAEAGLKRQLNVSLGSLQTCIDGLKDLTPEVGPGFGEPDGDPDSSLVGSPPKAVVKKGGRRPGRAPATTKGVEKKRAAPRGGKK